MKGASCHEAPFLFFRLLQLTRYNGSFIRDGWLNVAYVVPCVYFAKMVWAG